MIKRIRRKLQRVDELRFSRLGRTTGRLAGTVARTGAYGSTFINVEVEEDEDVWSRTYHEEVTFDEEARGYLLFLPGSAVYTLVEMLGFYLCKPLTSTDD